jgi:hypothetical protein
MEADELLPAVIRRRANGVHHEGGVSAIQARSLWPEDRKYVIKFSDGKQWFVDGDNLRAFWEDCQQGVIVSDTESDEQTELDDEEHKEGVESLAPEVKMRDELMGTKIERTVGGVVFQGTIEDIEVGETTGERLYLICYSDGDVEHLTAEQVRACQTDVPVGDAAGCDPCVSPSN